MILQERTVATHLGDISLLTSGPANSAGTPLVLLHGMLATKEFWTHLIPHLPAHWQILAPDLWSVARDADTGTELDFQHLAEIVEAFRLALALPRIHLMAQDLGCLVQLRFVHAYPHSVQRLIWLSPSLYPDLKLPGGLQWWRRPLIGHLMSGPFLQASLSRYYVQGTVQKQQAAAVCHQARGTFQARTAKSCFHRWLHWGQPDSLFWDHPEMIRRIRQASLVVYGDSNPYVHYSQVERLGRHLENAQVLILPDCGHFPTLDQSQRVLREVPGFLDTD